MFTFVWVVSQSIAIRRVAFAHLHNLLLGVNLFTNKLGIRFSLKETICCPGVVCWSINKYLNKMKWTMRWEILCSCKSVCLLSKYSKQFCDSRTSCTVFCSPLLQSLVTFLALLKFHTSEALLRDLAAKNPGHNNTNIPCCISYPNSHCFVASNTLLLPQLTPFHPTMLEGTASREVNKVW